MTASITPQAAQRAGFREAILDGFLAEHARGPAGGQFLPADLIEALTAAGETAYCWDLVSNRLSWADNAAQVLGVTSTDAISSEAKYLFLIAPEHLARRSTAIQPAAGRARDGSAPYCVQYRLLPRGRSGELAKWVEDQGRWWAGPDGRPARALGIVRVINDRHEEEQRLRYAGNHDELTGLLRRDGLIGALHDLLVGQSGSRDPASFLMIAINDLSMTNETFGFEVGDEVIAAVARLVRSNVRADDVVGRYASNKLGVILRGCGAAQMRTVAERLLQRVRETRITTVACPLTATLSIGGVALPEQASSAQEAFGRAMQALSQAKRRLVPAFSSFESSQQRTNIRVRNIPVAKDITSALQAGRMRLALQPIVSTRTWQPALHECLLRMELPDGTTVTAGEFIGIAEQLGLAQLIDRRTAELAIGILERHPDLHLALNLSGLTCGDDDWLRMLERLSRGGNLARRLTIEITETAAIQDVEHSARFVESLKELGCRVAIDDFGAGYTSFRTLKDLPVDMVKIDGAFIENLANNRSDRVFVKAMVELARSLKMETVAEWVGDDDTARLLAEAGIDYLQGFHFGEPVIAEVAKRE